MGPTNAERKPDLPARHPGLLTQCCIRYQQDPGLCRGALERTKEKLDVRKRGKVLYLYLGFVGCFPLFLPKVPRPGYVPSTPSLRNATY